MARPLSLLSLSDALPVQPTFTGVPIEIVRHIGSFLAYPSPKPDFFISRAPRISKNLINLSSTSKALYNAFKRDRYNLVVLRGTQSSVDFVDFLLQDVEALRSVRQLVVDSVCPLHDYDSIARLVSHLRHLQIFFYNGSHGLHPRIVRALCLLQKRGRLETLHLGTASFESVTELAKKRSHKQGGALSNLRGIILHEPVSSQWDDFDGSAEVPPWLEEHPHEMWEVVEHDLLHDVAAFLSRSRSTLEYLDLRLNPFYTSTFFSTDAPHRTMFFDEAKPRLLSNDDSSDPAPPRVLEFPRLKTLSLPPMDLTSPVAIQLLRHSPLLEHLSLIHDPIKAVGTPRIELPSLSHLVWLKVVNIPHLEEEFGSPPFLDVVESLRGTTSLKALEILGAGSLSYMDQPRLVQVSSSFLNLASLSLSSPDWRCSMNEVQSALSSLKSLTNLSFDFDPNFTDPPSPVPEASIALIEDGDLGPPDYVVGLIMDYFYEDIPKKDRLLGVGLLDRPTKEFRHFTSIVEKLALSVVRLKTIDWDFDELYSLVWDVERGEDGKVTVKGVLSCDELDEMAFGDDFDEDDDGERETEDEEDEEEWVDEDEDDASIF